MLLDAEDIIKILEEYDDDYEVRRSIYILDTDNDCYKTIDSIRVDSEGDIIIDISE